MPSSWREARLAKRKAEDTSKDTSKDTSEVPGTGDDGYGVKLSAAKRLRLERDRIIAGGRKAARTDGKLVDADAEEAPEENVEESVATLLDQAEVMRSKIAEMSEAEQAKTEQETAELRLLKEANTVSSNALSNARDEAAGTRYTTSLKTTWTAPKHILAMSEAQHQAIREKWSILVEGEDIPAPLRRFQDMKLPRPILDSLKAKNITRPTPIQMQGLPVALSGRDMVGIAFTGSGKTVTFSLPLIMAALEEERKMPLIANEGPVGCILAPSRELARQTYDVVVATSKILSDSPSGKYPPIRTQLLIGGEDKREQLKMHQERGVHAVIATPGRLKDFLGSKKMNFRICRFICLDEADRMLDLGFDEEVGEIMNHFHYQRQTLLFSATFPKKFQDFAKTTLVRPVVVNVGRAGAANLDVIQEVEYVKQEAKIVYLLECLQKTAPPVCIFCERKGDVDDIHEYLLLKGVEAVSIHGGKDQEERNEAIKLFKDNLKDVLVSTDVAAKGLDFPDIQHVINFDMPSEIENYVHRIGRTGRCGKTGVATTFINKSCEESTLLDLKHLLREAHQRVPPVLEIMDDPQEEIGQLNGVKGCAFCGGLGHRITDCPKLDKDARRVAGGKKDALNSGDGYGGDW
ncbi:hypothetical protein TrVE_jg11996 [Triparma verrucosa]|uniref:RNA helicase n=2 Tax=Triparma TaxID=722752 RepID=A0A9W6ZPZ5_9STRA|nr:hypothetical protein TrST_g2219 [Triparma strigata]GMI15540.1 hypothetical protein TrVE_jg11996 [Triparma verrucosa]